MTQENNKPLLPDFLKKPSMLIWTALIPQALLLLYNCWVFWLISEEAQPQNLNTFGILFAAQVSLLVLILAAWFSTWKRKALIRWPWFLVLLIGQIAYLWFFAVNLWRAIPTNVDRWIIDEGIVAQYAFTLMMPGIFYVGLQLACFELRISKFKNFGLSLLLTMVAPALFYFVSVIATFMARGYNAGYHFYAILWPLFFVVVTILMFVGLIRLLVLLYDWIAERGNLGQMLFAIAIAIICPMAGLSLNSLIPFPADFQSLAVYIMTIVNGVVLLLPRFKRFEAGLLFLRSSTYPFSLYFFLVFLPFMPISLLAIFALGSGFLILAPVLLFVLHTKKIADDFKASASSIGAKISILVIILGVMLMPGYFFWQAFGDKHAVNQALQYAYSPDYQTEQNFKGNLKAAGRAILNLKKFKDGIQLPYISDVYNRVVFEGMVLPDEKISHMFYIFTGKDIDNLTKGANYLGRGGLGAPLRRTRQGSLRGWPGALRRIDRNVSLESVETQLIERGDYNKARVNFFMHNQGASSEAEFLTNIEIPEGVVVSGFKLRVDKEYVTGKIFERRTAQWVYHMIRDFVRRDPGLLFYKNSRQLELRVYPFMANETREAEIEFEFPADFSPVIKIGEKTVVLAQKAVPQGSVSQEEILSAQDSGGNTFLFLPQDRLKVLPALRRQPYLYFILDRSEDGLENLSTYAKYIETVAAKYPEAANCRITAANFSLQGPDVWIDPHRKDAILAALEAMTLPRRGGLDLERAIKTELLRYMKNLSRPSNDVDWQTYPLFVVIAPDKTKIEAPQNLDFYRDLVPECGYYLFVSGMEKTEIKPFWGTQVSLEPIDVVVLGYGPARAVLASNLGTSGVAYFSAQENEKDFSREFLCFDAQQKQFTGIGFVKNISGQNEFINRLSLLERDKQIILNPSSIEASLPKLIEQSRNFSVLIPSTSFIVVERGVQWKALQMNEKKRIATSNAFEFEEDFKTPSPSFWIMSGFLLIFAFLRKWFKYIKRADC